ncbi:MAG: nucleotide-binding protein [Anaerolineae bacterium]|nr:nucleotide-binding protein [Anaerolineae bacterium]
MNPIPPVILFVDNDKDFIEIRKHWLEKEGFIVQPAYNLAEARDILAEGKPINLAILDVRLMPNDPDGDESGLYLAIETVQSHIPTMILTNFTAYEYVRRVQTWYRGGDISFVDKREKKSAFLQAIRGLLKKRNIFIVHGHDTNAKDAVEKFILQLKLEPVVLANEVDDGRTIFQKLEDYASVAYVIALLTSDDVCVAQQHTSTPRARQNVIFELGYFIGKYGTTRVKALVSDNVELPSDIHGLLYIPFHKDSEDWKVRLVREMRSVGLDVHYP